MIRDIKLTVIIATAYYLVAKFTLFLVVIPGSATPIWPSAGIALGFALIYGRRSIVGILLGCFLLDFNVNVMTLDFLNLLNAVSLSLSVSAVATIQALVGAFLIHSILKSIEMVKATDVAKFIFITFAFCLISSSLAVGLRALSRTLAWHSYFENWLTWWVGDVIGVFLFVPLTLAWISNEPVWKQRRTSMTIVLPLAFVMICGIFTFAYHTQAREIEKKFHAETEAFMQSLEGKIDEFYLSLNSMGGFYESSDYISRKEFSTFSHHLIKRLPELKSIAWVPRVERNEIESLMEQAKKEGYESFYIKRFNEAGELVRAEGEVTRFPVFYIEPFEKNSFVLGVDNGAEPRRREASFRARDLGKMTATAAIILGQDRVLKEKSILLVYPIYAKGQVLDTLEGRRSNFQGYITATVSIADLIESALHTSMTMADINFQVYDVSLSEAETLYVKMNRKDAQSETLTKASNLFIGERDWRIIFTPTRSYGKDTQAGTLWYLMLGALLLSSMLTSVVLLLTGQNANISRVVEQRTRALSSARSRLSEKNKGMNDLVTDLQEQKNNLESQRSAMISLMEDLEEQRNQIEDQSKKLEKASQAKSEFLATMSHEIRTPMNAILGMVELLSEDEKREDKIEYLRALKRAGETLMELINDVLDFSKIESGMLSLEEVPTDLEELIVETEKLFKPRTDAKGLDFEIKISTDVPHYVFTDPTRIRQLLINLLGNSIKFTETGKITLVVDLSNQVSEVNFPGMQDITFKIIDTGIGIREDRIHSLFEPFTQADSSTTRKYGGSGLGLSICEKIVHLMGGELDVESVYGEGSTFSFTLPMKLNVSSQQEEGLRAEKTGGFTQRQVEVGQEFPQMDRPLDVLLVEDSPDNRLLIEAFLKKAPVKVEIAVNGEEAVEKATKHSFDVILMDMQMPIMDGYTATKKLREWEESRDASSRNLIYALTANALKEDADKCLAAGCDHYLSKPIKKATLHAVIRKVMESKKP